MRFFTHAQIRNG